MGITYFYAQKLVSLIHEITDIDFTENEKDFEKFRDLTKQEASRLRFMINVRPAMLKGYIYKNIINPHKPF